MATVTPDAPESSIDEDYKNKFNSSTLSDAEKERLRALQEIKQGEIDSNSSALSDAERAHLQSIKDDHQGEIDDRLGRAQNESSADEEPSVQSQEENPAHVNNFTGDQNTSSSVGLGGRLKGTFTGSKKGPAAVIVTSIVLLLFGSVSFFGLLLTPIAVLSNTNLDLNDVLSGSEKQAVKIISKQMSPRAAANDATFGCSGITGPLPISCRFSTMGEKFVEKLEAQGIKVEGEKVFGNRIKPKKLTFKGESFDAKEFTARVKTDPELFRAYSNAKNMSFLTLKGETFINKVMGKFGLSEADPGLKGTEDERTKQLAEGKATTGSSELKFTEIDPDAETGEKRYTIEGDPTGTIYAESQLPEIKARTKAVIETKTSLSGVKVGALEALNALGMVDAACGFNNLIGNAAIAQKIAAAAQLAQYAVPIATLIGEIKAGDIKPEDAQAVQRFFNDIDARKAIGNLAHGLDDKFKSALGVTADSETMPNPDYGKTATDSEVIKMSINGNIATPSAADKNYALGYGSSTLVSAAAKWGRFSNNLNLLPGSDMLGVIPGYEGVTLGEACKQVRKGWVRAGGLIVGVVAGVVTGGLFTTGNAAILAGFAIGSYVLNYAINAALSGSVIGEAMNDASVDRGTAFWTGISVLHSLNGQMRGMVPGNADQLVAYQKEQDVVRQEYIALERENSNPLDVENPYSVTGSMALSLYDHLPKDLSPSTVASLSTSLSSFVFGGLSSITSPYSAHASSLDPERFKQCDDKDLKDLGIDADVQCNVRYFMPEDSLKLDPLDVALYMEKEGYVEENTTSGWPKDYSPLAPEASQGLAMDFIKGIKDQIYSGRNYGSDIEGKTPGNAAKFGKFLDYCVYRTAPYGVVLNKDNVDVIGGSGEGWASGKFCLKPYEDGLSAEQLNYFRAYVFNISVDDDLNGPIEEDCPPNATSKNATVSSASAEKINTAIEEAEQVQGHSSLLHGKGEKFVEFGQKYGIDANFVVGIMRDENQLGAYGDVDSALYGPGTMNFGNIKGSGPCGSSSLGGEAYAKYCSVDEGIEAVFKLLDTDMYRKYDKFPGYAAGSIAQVRQLYCPEGDGAPGGQCNLDNFIETINAVGKTLGVTFKKDSPVYTSASAGYTNTTASGTVAVSKTSSDQLKSLISSYGLPAPDQAAADKLRANLTNNEKAGWAAQQFLNGEKAYKSKGGDIKEYLTTAWVWAETGAENGPDPYQANCHDTEGSGTAYQFCGSMYQVGGAQLGDHNGQITKIFQMLYGDSELTTVLDRTFENSSKATNESWDYHKDSGSLAQYADSRKTATLADLPPQSDFNSPKTQFLTALLAKDPAMAAALNSFAVSDGDLIAAIKAAGSDGYMYGSSFYDAGFRQTLSNMILALYDFDGSGPGSSPTTCAGAKNTRYGGGKGVSVVWGGVGDPDLSYGLGSDAGLDLYKYGIDMGLGGNGTLHTGLDIPMPAESPIYAPIGGLITCSGTGSEGIMVDGTECNAFNDYMGQGNGRIEIKTDSGDIVILGHTSTGLVKVGDRVNLGQQVGTVGGMNGFHTHLEVRVKDPSVPVGWRLVDPLEYFGGV